MSHGDHYMENRNRLPGNRCELCDGLLGNFVLGEVRVAKFVSYRTRHPAGFYTPTKMLGYVHWRCPTHPPLEPLEPLAP